VTPAPVGPRRCETGGVCRPRTEQARALGLAASPEPNPPGTPPIGLNTNILPSPLSTQLDVKALQSSKHRPDRNPHANNALLHTTSPSHPPPPTHERTSSPSLRRLPSLPATSIFAHRDHHPPRSTRCDGTQPFNEGHWAYSDKDHAVAHLGFVTPLDPVAVRNVQRDPVGRENSARQPSHNTSLTLTTVAKHPWKPRNISSGSTRSWHFGNTSFGTLGHARLATTRNQSLYRCPSTVDIVMHY
jgi:hypothetical protein